MRSSEPGRGAFPSALRILPAAALAAAVLLAASLLASCAGAPAPAPAAPAPEPEKPSLSALIGRKDGAAIREFFGSRELIDAADAEGLYPLHRAVLEDAPEIAELLLGLGAKPDPLDPKGRTPLRLALDAGRWAVARVLAERGASLFAKDAAGTSVAQAAIAKGGEAFRAVFTAKTANARSEDGGSALHLAADALAEDAVAGLLDLGADPALRDKAGRSPLDLALLHPDRIESARIAERLCLRGPAPSFPGYAWFAQAARASNYGSIRYENGNSPLHEAVSAKAKGFVEFLLSKKAPPNARNGAGSAPLHEAVRSGWLEGAELLLKGGADPNVRDGFDNTPLHIALPEAGRAEGVALLLRYGADPSLKDRNGNTPLHVAVQVGYPLALVETLLGSGSPPNAANAAGDTPLHLALRSGRLEYAPALLARQADIFLANGKGETPLSLALGQVASQTGAGLAAILTPANVNGRDNLGNGPLAVATSLAAPPEAIALIVSEGGDPNARNNAGDAPLHLAVRRSLRPQGEALLAAKADVFAANARGETPLVLALTAPRGPEDWLFDS
ncbi:MAG TPA: ankyrin repeat domain-containing protein, partial [Spirochaetales bacterium]|nr:ankyrin repeat domain-containing protein [Spirochaetales bacterium]